MSLKPPKSTTTWWSMRMSVSFSTVLMVQAAPASENAELNIASVWAGTTVPSVALAARDRHHRVARDAHQHRALPVGGEVQQDRGVRALARDVAAFSAAFPDRLSEPMQQDVLRLLGARPGPRPWSAGRRRSGRRRSSWVMLPLSLLVGDEGARRAGRRGSTATTVTPSAVTTRRQRARRAAWRARGACRRAAVLGHQGPVGAGAPGGHGGGGQRSPGGSVIAGDGGVDRPI